MFYLQLIGNNSKLLQEEQQHANKKTTTKTTTTMKQPIYMVDEEKIPINHQRIEYFQPITSPSYLKQNVEIQDNPSSYAIRVEHHPKVIALNWSKLDTYLHIFLTFYYGHFAAMLFFDGVLRNIINLYVIEQSTSSIFLYILSIVFSIAMLAFTIWFMTICWRWWRYKSLGPESIEYTQQPLAKRVGHSNNNRNFLKKYNFLF